MANDRLEIDPCRGVVIRMESVERSTDLPVLLLHNVDPSWESTDIAGVFEAVHRLKLALQKEGHPVVEVPIWNSRLADTLKPFNPQGHIVLNWCEELPGAPRSDFMVAQTLETLNFTYTGSSPHVLAFSWDKPAVKALLHKKGIATPRWQVVPIHKSAYWNYFPAIVKPTFEHCSHGITTDAVALNPQELKERIAFVQDVFHQPALIEDFIDGREFHVTLWGNGAIEALPAAEMDFTVFANLRDRLCTFDSKFTPGSMHYEKIEVRVPAALDEHERLRLNQTALRAYKALGCRDYARIDLRYRNGVFYVLDINPNSDLSPDTSMVYAAEAAGFSYGVVGSRLVNFAAQRHPVFGCRTDVSS
jgi:D-alanine-D-alanine ligase